MMRWLFMPFSKGSSSTLKQHVTSRLRQSDKYHKHLSYTICTIKLQLVKCNKKLINAKQSTRDMSCENKLTNIIFKNKENSARKQCASFILPFSFFLKKKIKKNT